MMSTTPQPNVVANTDDITLRSMIVGPTCRITLLVSGRFFGLRAKLLIVHAPGKTAGVFGKSVASTHDFSEQGAKTNARKWHAPLGLGKLLQFCLEILKRNKHGDSFLIATIVLTKLANQLAFFQYRAHDQIEGENDIPNQRGDA